MRGYLHSVIELVVELRVLDRGLALASKMFIALIPMTLLASSVFPRNSSFADNLVTRFGLTGEGAAAVRQLFASPAQIKGGISALSILILGYSVMSMAGALQRLYEDAWHLPRLKLRGLWRPLTWMLAFALYIALVTPIQSGLRSSGLNVVARVGPILVGTVVWVWTPYILLAGRVERRRLRPTGLLTAIGFAVFSMVSRVYMPQVMTTDAHRYGLIGAAFAMVSWLFAASVVLICTAALGAPLGGAADDGSTGDPSTSAG